MTAIDDVTTVFGRDGIARIALPEAAAAIGIETSRLARAAGVGEEALLDEAAFLGAVSIISRRTWRRAAVLAENAFPRVPCGVVLGLTSPFGERDVTRAYKRRALETHPDRGGDVEAFRGLAAARDEAMLFVADVCG